MDNRKLTVRRRMLSHRRELSGSQKKKADRAIRAAVLRLPLLQNARTVCTYLSLPEEVDTSLIVKKLFGMGKQVVVPKVMEQNLMLYEIRSMNDVAPGAFSLLEPKVTNPTIDASAVDLFIVPGIAFDRKGYRLGWGKGHYDRLLSGVHVSVIGLSYSQQVVDKLPASSYDIPMTVVVTEKEIFPAAKEEHD